MIRIRMIDEILRLNQEWTSDVLRDIGDKVDSITADYIRKRVGTSSQNSKATASSTSSELSVEDWIQALDDDSQRKNALNFLTQGMSLIKISKSQALRENVSNKTFPLLTQLNDIQTQIKAAELVYRYSSIRKHWMEVLLWFETRYLDTSISDEIKSQILNSMLADIRSHPYADDALNSLETSLFDFIELNENYELEVTATKILIINKLSQPPQRYFIRNKVTYKHATLTCTECDKAIKPSEAITVALLKGMTFCSRGCSTAYIMREKGSMNPRYW